ncbi:Maf family protein [Desulfofalx alkaliphila]|uniref:Maf family protein n=1 Tax=Desulfofalx alkaliphila TaxID=105483 RepID=UPI0004E106CE|nr:Maf family protein [Desulfofalx alkaliphila]
MALILASQSPRRREMLQRLGLDFEVQVASVEEIVPSGLKPAEVVEHLAALKARAVAGLRDEGLVIGSDTVVVKDGVILGKPANEEEAKEMLRRLQGTSHRVYSGVAVVNAGDGSSITGHRCTKVTFKPLSQREIEQYIATGEPMDKAGAYGVQGVASIFITAIEGCYHNVVGMPLELLAELLKKFNYNLLDNIVGNKEY